ncbi:MAG: hypothetical protein AAF035_03400 [Pseudomonadota bacterium]
MDIFERLASAHSVTASDVVALRREVFASEHVRKEHLMKLLSTIIEGEDCPEWQYLLNEAFEIYFLKSARPHGYFCDESINSLSLLRGHNRANPAATKALVHVLMKCRAAPPEAAKLAMDLLEADVLACGEMDSDKVVVLRDLLYAQGSGHGLGISRSEADMLFTIKDYLRGGHEHRDWIDLFCKAIGNHLMVQHGYIAPTRAEALRLDDWVEAPADGVGTFLGSMGKSLLNGQALDALRAIGARDRDCIYKKRNNAFEAAAADAEIITDEEAAWLADRIGQDGQFCAAEEALMAYLTTLCKIDLSTVLNRCARAA